MEFPDFMNNFYLSKSDRDIEEAVNYLETFHDRLLIQEPININKKLHMEVID